MTNAVQTLERGDFSEIQQIVENAVRNVGNTHTDTRLQAIVTQVLRPMADAIGQMNQTIQLQQGTIQSLQTEIQQLRQQGGGQNPPPPPAPQPVTPPPTPPAPTSGAAQPQGADDFFNNLGATIQQAMNPQGGGQGRRRGTQGQNNTP